MKKLLNFPFNWLKKKFKYYGGVLALIFYSFIAYFSNKLGRKRINRVLITQIFFTGNQALKIITIVSFALGAITILQLFTQLSQIGALEFVGKILNIVIVRELGPVITSFIVLSRSGTAIAAEIGTMMVNDEINALEMLGIDTLRYIVFPRIAGMVISVFFLTIYFNAIGILGGMLVGAIYNISFEMFSSYVLNAINYFDIFMSLFKGVVFGLFISAISIYYGFQAFTSTQVPQVTTKAVVSSIFALFGLDLFITLVSYM
ncbi:MAG: ABC transporter permease [Brevinematia bacterium]